MRHAYVQGMRETRKTLRSEMRKQTQQTDSSGGGDPAAIRHRAATLIRSGWLDEGLEALASLIGTPSADHPSFRLQLGQALLAAGRFEEAEKITLEGPLVWPNPRTGTPRTGAGETGAGDIGGKQ